MGQAMPPMLHQKGPGSSDCVPLQPIRTAAEPADLVSVDVLGPFPISAKGNKYIIVFMDLFTRYPYAYALPDQTAQTVADIFVLHYIPAAGIPRRLLSDNGPCFISNALKEACRILEIEKLYISPYHAAGNGAVERFNSSLATMLSFYTKDAATDWDVYINLVLLAYRNATNPMTGETPYFMNHGRDPHLPSSLLLTEPPTVAQDPLDYKLSLFQRMRRTWADAEAIINKQKDRMKDIHDRRTTLNPRSLSVGDRIYIFMPAIARHKSKKLVHKWAGPYRILKLSETNVKAVPISKPRAAPITVHLNRCKRDTTVAMPRLPAPDDEMALDDAMKLINKSSEPTAKTNTSTPTPAVSGAESSYLPSDTHRYPLRRKQVIYPS